MSSAAQPAPVMQEGGGMQIVVAAVVGVCVGTSVWLLFRTILGFTGMPEDVNLLLQLAAGAAAGVSSSIWLGRPSRSSSAAKVAAVR